jgi:hypothetical protein
VSSRRSDLVRLVSDLNLVQPPSAWVGRWRRTTTDTWIAVPARKHEWVRSPPLAWGGYYVVVSARLVGSGVAHSEMQGRTHRIGSVAWRGRSPSLGTWPTRGGLSARPSGSTEHEAGQARTERTRTRRTRFASAPSSVRNLRSQIAACRQLSFSPNLPLTLGNDMKAESALIRISAIL